MKAQSESVCVADSFRDNQCSCTLLLLHRNQRLQKNIPVQGVQAGSLTVTCRIFFLFVLPGKHYKRVQILCNALLRAYSATANALFLFRSSISVVP
jgi:hypothetical protein